MHQKKLMIILEQECIHVLQLQLHLVPSEPLAFWDLNMPILRPELDKILPPLEECVFY